MNITTTQEGKVHKVQLAGRLEAATVPVLKAEVQKLSQNKPPYIVFDMAGVTFVDSSGLGALVAALRTVNKVDGDIRIANLTPDVRSIFELTRMHRLFEIYPSSEVAIASYT